jgi:hypothetical protein
MNVSSGSAAYEQHLNHALDAASIDDLDAQSMRAKRLALIDCFEEEALERSTPQDALLGASTAVLHRLANALGEALVEYCDSHEPTLELLRDVYPDINLLQKLRRHIEFDRVVAASDNEVPARVGPIRSKQIPKQPATRAKNLSKGWPTQ